MPKNNAQIWRGSEMKRGFLSYLIRIARRFKIVVRNVPFFIPPLFHPSKKPKVTYFQFNKNNVGPIKVLITTNSGEEEKMKKVSASD